MGHLKRSCPNSLPPRPYPLNIDSCMYMYGCEVCSPNECSLGINCGNDGIYDISHSLVSLECKSTDDCLVMENHEYAWEPNDKSSEVIQVQGCLKQHVHAGNRY